MQGGLAGPAGVDDSLPGLSSPNPENKLFVGGAPPGTDENTLQQVRNGRSRTPGNQERAGCISLHVGIRGRRRAATRVLAGRVGRSLPCCLLAPTCARSGARSMCPSHHGRLHPVLTGSKFDGKWLHPVSSSPFAERRADVRCRCSLADLRRAWRGRGGLRDARRLSIRPGVRRVTAVAMAPPFIIRRRPTPPVPHARDLSRRLPSSLAGLRLCALHHRRRSRRRHPGERFSAAEEAPPSQPASPCTRLPRTRARPRRH